MRPYRIANVLTYRALRVAVPFVLGSVRVVGSSLISVR